MSKAILILEGMPEDCCQCPCFIERYEGNEWHSACWCSEKEVDEYGRPSLCPLNPMPPRSEIETIRIHMNAIKEALCNQGRWNEAQEYQNIVDKLEEILGEE